METRKFGKARRKHTKNNGHSAFAKRKKRQGVARAEAKQVEYWTDYLMCARHHSRPVGHNSESDNEE